MRNNNLKMGSYATYLGANGWLLEIEKTRILVDPWLYCDLIFYNSPWLIKGIILENINMPTNIDLILLTNCYRFVILLLQNIHQ